MHNLPTDPKLELAMSAVEARLAGLGDALRARDVNAIDGQATELQRALALAVEGFARAAKNGPLPIALRERLARAGGQVAIQRESLSRATAALDRAIDVLMPRDAVTLYSAQGAASRSSLGGEIQA
jgi:hypothetical protein